MSDKILKLDQAQTLYQDLRERVDALPTSEDIPEVPVQDVQVNGTSVLQNGIANVPIMEQGKLGVAKTSLTLGVKVNASGQLYISEPLAQDLKSGVQPYIAVTTGHQHESTFYGLAKAAGHDEKNSTESLGIYTPEAKGAIQKMLGVSDLIATEENNLIASKAYSIGDVFTANGKLYKATAAIAADAAIITDGASANCEETSVGEGFVKFTDIASTTNYGVSKINTNYGVGIYNGQLQTQLASTTSIKVGNDYYHPITPYNQHSATFYGLAKAAGADEKNSTLSVGQYTDTAKSAIRTMLGAVGAEDYASTSAAGVVKINTAYGIGTVQNALSIDQATVNMIKIGTDGFHAITPARQEQSVFYGLAKASGDTTQAASSNAIGTYTDEAKAAIRTMIGSIGDVQVNGTSIVSGGVANISVATSNDLGVVKVGAGLEMSSGAIRPVRATDTQIKEGTHAWNIIVPSTQNRSVFYGLASAAGDTTQSASSNAVGTYTDSAKASIKAMLGIQDGSTGTVDVTGTTPTITAVENTRYVCGEVTSLNFTPPASGISIVRFTSGSTVTVLTIPNTVKFPEWFDSTSLETNTIYEICVTDGVYGAVMSWAL